MSDTPTAEQRAEWERVANARCPRGGGLFDCGLSDCTSCYLREIQRAILAALSTVEAERDRLREELHAIARAFDCGGTTQGNQPQ